ncbi:MAG: small multi-drug export protein [Patescibacteria group bacterium]|nr:small multi-drug export protein [Patescibacteria group bacterium]
MTDVLIVIAVAALPIVELRGSIPLAIGILEMPPFEAALLSVLGNLIPIFLIYWFGNAWIKWTAQRQDLLHRITKRTLHRSRKAFDSKYRKYGMLALPLFVAIPLPMTGVVTGTLAAFLFGIPLRKSFPLLAIGVIIAGMIVTAMTTGALSFLDFLLVVPA